MLSILSSLTPQEQWAYGIIALAIITLTAHLSAQWFSHRLALKRGDFTGKADKKPTSDYSKFSGIWYGIHISRSRRTDNKIISKHKYEIQVTKGGKIIGNFLDFLADEEPWDYDIDGKVVPGGIIFNAISKLRPDLFSIQIFFNPTPTRLTGILVSYDYQDRPFFSPIFLARREFSPKELEDEIKCFKPEYYNVVEDFTEYNLPNVQDPKTGQDKGPDSSSFPEIE